MVKGFLRRINTYIILLLCLMVIGGCGTSDGDNLSVSQAPDDIPISAAVLPEEPPEPAVSEDIDDINNEDIANDESDEPDETDESDEVNEPSEIDEPNKTDEPEINQEQLTELTDELSVHVIDVGQGDSILVKLPNGQSMLIDGGNTHNAKGIINYLRNNGVTKINYVCVK